MGLVLLAWIDISWSLQYWEKRKWKPGDLAISSLIAITLARRINYRELLGAVWLYYDFLRNDELRGPLIGREKGHLQSRGEERIYARFSRGYRGKRTYNSEATIYWKVILYSK